MSGPIASAVVLPDADDAPPHPSPPASTATKRPRPTSTSPPPAPPKRRERGRERRLFGAVLGALAQNPSSAGQQRRAEIEKRQFAQRRHDDAESAARKAERLAARAVQRGVETRRFERLAIKARHESLLLQARFLCTKAEPRLYYRPWEISKEEEACVEAQVAEAREVVRREREEFEAREEAERAREKRASPDEWTYRGANVGDAAPAREAAHGADAPMQDQEMRDDAEPAAPQPADTDMTAEPDAADEPTKDADEEVVEAAEDTVIY
ncbi:pinin/SDK/memA/ protein conserved region-domain-containing protein [Boeremia exigua]|uniref:pinin/SDK/memA/ protein conserved region-domain-containing protein n=1 Tax=Boeremia exigua TaxID=749465 RepID=UPI001E8CB7AE|nr:pinin/SDK/memA/ protein conserved region-domain-containing protein [Boeremia exigua]KAH6625734.1 pinin/SDK/memA/ protein conserved region-domain-containing protein [Boeremia exigua]